MRKNGCDWPATFIIFQSTSFEFAATMTSTDNQWGSKDPHIVIVTVRTARDTLSAYTLVPRKTL